MPGKHAVPRFEQGLQAGKIVTIETPVRMLDEFLVAFVGCVDGMEERLGIAAVDEYGNAQTPAFLPDRIEAGVIDREQLSRLVAHAQSEILQEFQTTRSSDDRVVDLRDHLCAEVGVVDLAPIQLREDHETPGVGLDHLVDYGLQLVTPEAGEDDNGLHIGAIHHFDDALGRHVLIDPRGIVDVVMHVDHIELGPVDFMCGNVEHRDRLEVFEEQCLFLLGIRGGLVSDLG